MTTRNVRVDVTRPTRPSVAVDVQRPAVPGAAVGTTVLRGPQGIQGPTGPTGPIGPAGLHVGPNPPSNTDLVWMDTDELPGGVNAQLVAMSAAIVALQAQIDALTGGTSSPVIVGALPVPAPATYVQFVEVSPGEWDIIVEDGL